MQKVYLLLRQNQQTGPFNAEELLQFDLKPHDLIWIEGKSAGWYYPQEIEALRPHLGFLKNVSAPEKNSTPASSLQTEVPSSPKKIFVAMPGGATAKPAPPAAVNEKPQPVAAEKNFTKAPEEETLKTSYAKPLAEVETDYMNWVYEKKKKKAVVPVRGALGLVLLAGVAIGAWWVLSSTGEEEDKPAAVLQPAPTSLHAQPEEEVLATDAPVVAMQKAVAGKKQKEKASPTKSTAVKAGVVKPQQEEALIVPASQQTAKDEAAPVTQEEAKTDEEKTEPVTAEAPKEKKKLKDRIADLFRKKPEEKTEETRPAEEGRRESTRREAGSNLAQLVTVRFDVPNDWMMGIKGAKATLTNRSSETLAKALVQVTYYNDDGDVLDKKTIAFSNVKAKQTQTVLVPDHQTATKLEYTVVTATGVGEPVAAR